MLTTLTTVLVLPLVAPKRYIACACNVGDSLAYVYSPKHGVREITQGEWICVVPFYNNEIGPVAKIRPEKQY